MHWYLQDCNDFLKKYYKYLFLLPLYISLWPVCSVDACCPNFSCLNKSGRWKTSQDILDISNLTKKKSVKHLYECENTFLETIIGPCKWLDLGTLESKNKHKLSILIAMRNRDQYFPELYFQTEHPELLGSFPSSPLHPFHGYYTLCCFLLAIQFLFSTPEPEKSS